MFIFKKEKALTKSLCDSFIDTFENCPDHYKHRGVVSSNKKGVHSDDKIKTSTDITFNPSHLKDPLWKDPLNELIAILEKAKEDYISRYHVAFGNMDPFEISSHFNMQKYAPGEAYYAYHCERAGINHSNRILVWVVYLNDVYDGGETEFFYYHHFEPARQGKLVIFPTEWTHLHRGIISTENKYILTGWHTYTPQLNEESEFFNLEQQSNQIESPILSSDVPRMGEPFDPAWLDNPQQEEVNEKN